jgi:hypothetical protein
MCIVLELGQDNNLLMLALHHTGKGPPELSIIAEKKPQYFGISFNRNASRRAFIISSNSGLPLVNYRETGAIP